MRSVMMLAVLVGLPCGVGADVFTNQQPVSGGGVSRWSQLWQDPGPDGNDLDSDAKCWEDFTLAAPSRIDRIEWWGTGACELGFRIEVWRQDPGTIAYQPLAVFDQVGGDPPVQPEARFDTTAYTTTPGPGGIFKYTLDLSSPIELAANDASNPRWFIGIIGLTRQAYYTWNWSQGLGGSTRTYQFIRGYHRFFVLPEGRALVLGGTTPCVGATVEASPADRAVCRSGASPALSVTAGGTGPFAYGWEVEDAAHPGVWIPLTDGAAVDGMVFTGSGTAELSVAPEGAGLAPGLARRLRCLVENGCGSAWSGAATLTVCAADVNCDGFLDFFDYDDYVTAFEGGTPAADFNGDGFIDFFDYDDFVTAFEVGC